MKRKTELTWLNLIFTAMVLWSHCSAHPITTLDHSSWQYVLVFMLQRLTYMSVYGFFFISGVKLMLPHRREPTTLEYWKGRAKGLLIPYVIATMIYYLWFVFCLRYFPFSWKDFFDYLLHGTISSPFYFLIAMFQFVLLAPVIKYAVRHWSSCMLMLFSLGITWFSAQHFAEVLEFIRPGTNFAYTDRIFLTYLVYYVAGCCVGLHYDEFIAQLNRSRALVIGAFVFFTVTTTICTCLWAAGLKPAPFLEELHFLYILSSILFLYWLATKITWTMPAWLSRVDRASFTIYLYHSLFISFYDNYVAGLFPQARISFLFLGRLLFIYVGCTLCCVLWHQLRGALSPKKTAK